MRWGTFVSFNRQVKGQTVMSGRDQIVQVKIRKYFVNRFLVLQIVEKGITFTSIFLKGKINKIN